jgi:hypothetical protein
MKKLRFIKQRVKRGYADEDVWSMNYWFIKTVVPMLKQLKEEKHGYPFDMTEKEWDDILDEMIFNFTEADEDTCSMKNEYWEKYYNSPEKEELRKQWIKREEEINQYQNDCKNKAFELFSKYFWSLWD